MMSGEIESLKNSIQKWYAGSDFAFDGSVTVFQVVKKDGKDQIKIICESVVPERRHVVRRDERSGLEMSPQCGHNV